MKVKMGSRAQRACAVEAGLTHSTFSRLINGTTIAKDGVPLIQSETVFRVCEWLGVPIATFTEWGQPPTQNTLDTIEWHLLRDEKLTHEQAIAFSNMLRAAYIATARKGENDGLQG